MMAQETYTPKNTNWIDTEYKEDGISDFCAQKTPIRIFSDLKSSKVQETCAPKSTNSYLNLH